MFQIKDRSKLSKNNIDIDILCGVPSTLNIVDDTESYIVITQEVYKHNSADLRNLKHGVFKEKNVSVREGVLKYLISCTNIVYKFADIYEEIQNIDTMQAQTMYKTTESLKDKDNNTIRKGTKHTQDALEELGLDIQDLIQNEQVMEIKVVK